MLCLSLIPVVNPVLSEEWIDYAVTPSPSNPKYRSPESTYAFTGHQQQIVMIVPEYDLVVVRLGYSFEDGASKLEELMGGIIAAFPDD